MVSIRESAVAGGHRHDEGPEAPSQTTLIVRRPLNDQGDRKSVV